MIIGADVGGSWSKFASAQGVRQHPSDLGEYVEMNLTNKLAEDEFIYEYNGKKGFAGMLARRESEFSGSKKGTTKAHEDAKLRLLIGLTQFDAVDFQIVVGQPIGEHNEAEKQKIKAMLQGRQEITVNGRKKVFLISRVEVAAEGASVGLLHPPQMGKKRIIDIGSGTVNLGTVYRNGSTVRFLNKESLTAPFGIETIRNLQPDYFARMIYLKTENLWSRDDDVDVCGGSAEKMLPHLHEYFPAAKLVPDPSTVNARAFYEIGRKLYG